MAQATGRRSVLLWRTLCLSLAAVIVAELVMSGRQDTASGDPDGVSAAPPGQAELATQANRPSRTAFLAILARSVFEPSRHLAAVDDISTTSTALQMADIKLTGVIISPTERFALLRRANSPLTFEVTEGQVVDGWTLDTVRHDSVRLSHDGAVIDLLLQDPALN